MNVPTNLYFATIEDKREAFSCSAAPCFLIIRNIDTNIVWYFKISKNAFITLQVDKLQPSSWPCQKRTVTGASTRCTLLSSTKISLARRHSALTSPSLRYSQRLRRSICSSKQLLPPFVRVEAAMFVVNIGNADSAGKDGVDAGMTAAAPASVMLFAAIIVDETGCDCAIKEERRGRLTRRKYTRGYSTPKDQNGKWDTIDLFDSIFSGSCLQG